MKDNKSASTKTTLTQENQRFLKESRINSKTKKYTKFKGYAVNGQACVCKADTNEAIYTACMENLSNFT